VNRSSKRLSTWEVIMDKQRIFLLTYSAIFLVIMAETASAGSGKSDRDIAHHLITKAGTSRGLCSLLGCEGGTLALELVRDSQFFLYVQDPRGATVAAAYKALDVDGLYGTRVLVERKPLDSLAFADNTVDVVLAASCLPAKSRGTDIVKDGKPMAVIVKQEVTGAFMHGQEKRRTKKRGGEFACNDKTACSLRKSTVAQWLFTSMALK